MEINERIEQVIDRMRPYLMNDGGDIQFVKFENGIVYVKMLGACSHCGLVDYTIKDGIEAMLIAEIAEVKEVVQITEEE